MRDVVFQFLFFGFFIGMAGLETFRRTKNAKRLALVWLEENSLSPLAEHEIKANAFVWPVRVTLRARDATGQEKDVVLRVGGLSGGTFPGTIKCESSKLVGEDAG